MKEWRQRTHNIFFWEYYLYTWLPWREMPVVYPHLISQDLRMLADFGKGEFIESESWGNNGGVSESMQGRMCFPATQHLNLYVTAKALWNTKLDVDHVLDEYYTQFYGAGQRGDEDLLDHGRDPLDVGEARWRAALARTIIRPIASNRATSKPL